MQIWLKKFGSTDDLQAVLANATGAATGSLSEKEAIKIRDEFYVAVVEDQAYEPDEYPAMFVGHAAANTILTATDSFVFDPDDLRNDFDLDPDAYEPSYLVASAFAGRLNKGDSERRRKFWEWYLSTAVAQVIT